MKHENDSRYPYTHACDHIRMMIEYGDCGCQLSRSDASQIRSEIARIINMDDHVLAEKLADDFLEHQDAITEKSANMAKNWLRKKRQD